MARSVGRYVLFQPIAAGGMGTVHLGRMFGEAGFTRVVAIKVMNASASVDPEAAGMFLDEARVAAQVRHPNVVSVLDVVEDEDRVMLVMEYVHGLALSRLVRLAAGQRPPLPVVSAIITGVLHGLHAAHEAKDSEGRPLDLVHRDVSPQNILVGADGVARLADFGVAKAAGRLQPTRDGGGVKGKLTYMAPEQLGRRADRRSDLFSTAVVLWELLTGRRLFDADSEAEIVARVIEGAKEPPSVHGGELVTPVDDLVMQCLAVNPGRRPDTAREMARELEALVPPASPIDVGEWVEKHGGAVLSAQAALVREMESTGGKTKPTTVIAAPELLAPELAPKEPKTARPSPPPLRFGVYLLESKRMLGPMLDGCAEWLGGELGVEVVMEDIQTYEMLARKTNEGQLDIVWLPPIVYLHVGKDAVVPVAASRRGDRDGFETALIVRTDSSVNTLEELKGARAAWVDPWSAAGYVIPRLRMKLNGIDPSTLFSSEVFYGTHTAAVRALVAGGADVAATYARVDASGNAIGGGWTEIGVNVRVLATFGEIPADVIAVRATLPVDERKRIGTALIAGSRNKRVRGIIGSIFGADELGPVEPERYEALRTVVDLADSLGVSSSEDVPHSSRE